ncbi:MAG: Fur family transcriptional regulator [Candidatus Dormibacteria bacterium]
MSENLHATVHHRLRGATQRYTSGRRDLVEILSSAGQPLTMPEILAAGRLSQSSAYRNLTVLESAEVVRRVVTHGEFCRFELAEELTRHHHHMVCDTCGVVNDFELTSAGEEALERALVEVARGTGFTPTGHRLDLVGHCHGCAG